MRQDDALQILRSLASLAATVQVTIEDDELRRIAHRDIVDVLAAVNEAVMEQATPAAVAA